MRQSRPKESLERLCTLFGVSRQAYYEAQLHESKTSIAHMIVLTLGLATIGLLSFCRLLHRIYIFHRRSIPCNIPCARKMHHPWYFIRIGVWPRYYHFCFATMGNQLLPCCLIGHAGEWQPHQHYVRFQFLCFLKQPFSSIYLCQNANAGT